MAMNACIVNFLVTTSCIFGSKNQYAEKPTTFIFKVELNTAAKYVGYIEMHKREWGLHV
jgi:hypothetical protein